MQRQACVLLAIWTIVFLVTLPRSFWPICSSRVSSAMSALKKMTSATLVGFSLEPGRRQKHVCVCAPTVLQPELLVDGLSGWRTGPCPAAGHLGGALEGWQSHQCRLARASWAAGLECCASRWEQAGCCTTLGMQRLHAMYCCRCQSLMERMEHVASTGSLQLKRVQVI